MAHIPLLNSDFGAVPLDAPQWQACIGMASLVMWLGEVRTVVHHAWIRRALSVVATPNPTLS